MKRYTTLKQTDKLKELGFYPPQGVCTRYSLAELIEMLPLRFESNCGELYLMINPEVYSKTNETYWYVIYETFMHDEVVYNISAKELIDAVYEMVVELKEKKII